LQQKIDRQDFRYVDRLKHIPFRYTAAVSQDAIKGVPGRMLKGPAMVFRVHHRHFEFPLTY